MKIMQMKEDACRRRACRKQFLTLLILTCIRNNAASSSLKALTSTSTSTAPSAPSSIESTSCDHEFCLDGINCHHVDCSGCSFHCFQSSDPNISNQKSLRATIRCGATCTSPTLDKFSCERDNCRECPFCEDLKHPPSGSSDKVLVRADSSCPSPNTYFKDVTSSLFAHSSHASVSLDDPNQYEYFDRWKRSGKPYLHYTSPLFIDLNGDGVLDYFNSLHENSMRNGRRMELALTVLHEAVEENDIEGKIGKEENEIKSSHNKHMNYTGNVDCFRGNNTIVEHDYNDEEEEIKGNSANKNEENDTNKTYAMTMDEVKSIPGTGGNNLIIVRFGDDGGKGSDTDKNNGNEGKDITRSHTANKAHSAINDSIGENGTSSNDAIAINEMRSSHGDIVARPPLGLKVNGHSDTPENDKTISHAHLEPLLDRIFYDDDDGNDDIQIGDFHGMTMMDLDNDGILDLYISQGGGGGTTIPQPARRDNLLFWGNKQKEENLLKEATENIRYANENETTNISESTKNHEKVENSMATFRGGRSRAVKAGLSMRYGRARFNYILDANGDGLLDIFVAQNRRIDNEIAPGVLLINQGNRTWKEDRSVMEFSNSAIWTDADGDGIANEFMIPRDFCFPKRVGPNFSHPVYGEFTQEIKAFCKTRPVGTTAVYKWVKGSMTEISDKYKHISPEKIDQPPGCPHGLYSGDNNCSVLSMASADFDGDKKADHIMLYEGRIVFYFSSGRPSGALPTRKEYIGFTIKLPKRCASAISIRVVDMDNSGIEDILVVCKSSPTFLLYTNGGKSETDWTLQKRNKEHSECGLGDLTERSLFEITERDINDACASRKMDSYYGKICDTYETSGKRPALKTKGLTLADLNNDGFQDAAVATSFGYLRFFHNVPSAKIRSNTFIIFELFGDGKETNIYGIGATLLLRSSEVSENHEQLEPNIRTQFREISSHQHVTDKHGHKDNRITFGLGVDQRPLELLVRWPNEVNQKIDLQQWSFEVLDPPSINVIPIKYHVTTKVVSSVPASDTAPASTTAYIPTVSSVKMRRGGSYAFGTFILLSIQCVYVTFYS